MNWFQILGLSFSAAALAVTLTAASRRRLTATAATAWALLWITAGISIAFPSVTIAAARVLGIGRGADLVVYAAILAMFAGFFSVYVRLRRIEAEITKIVRHIALEESEQVREDRQKQ